MRKNEALNSISRTFHKIGFELKKHSPEILVGVGIIGVVASTVMACKATTKVKGILEETKNDIDQIHRCMDDNTLIDSGQYSEQDGKKDLTIVYAKTGLKLAKLYAPSAVVGVLSIGSILASHRILNERNVSIAAAYAVVDSSFKDYRKRVTDRFGEQVDKELRYNIKSKQVETVEIDESGKETTAVEEIEVVESDLAKYSPYAKWFDESSRYYERDSELNLFFLRQTQNYANDKLRSQGHLFLNEVYDMLDLPRSREGASIGWIYDKHEGVDNYVDFGIYDTHKQYSRDFINGYERKILLDFNVDGYILSKLPSSERA